MNYEICLENVFRGFTRNCNKRRRLRERKEMQADTFGEILMRSALKECSAVIFSDCSPRQATGGFVIPTGGAEVRLELRGTFAIRGHRNRTRPTGRVPAARSTMGTFSHSLWSPVYYEVTGPGACPTAHCAKGKHCGRGGRRPSRGSLFSFCPI